MLPGRRRLSTSEQGASQQGGRRTAESAPQAAARSAQSAGRGRRLGRLWQPPAAGLPPISCVSAQSFLPPTATVSCWSNFCMLQFRGFLSV